MRVASIKIPMNEPDLRNGIFDPLHPADLSKAKPAEFGIQQVGQFSNHPTTWSDERKRYQWIV